MRRWHWTVGLGTLAVVAAALAPRLLAQLDRAPSNTAPRVTPPDVPEPPESDPGLPTGHLQLDAGLDYRSIKASDATERFLTVTVTAPDITGEDVRRDVDLAVVIDASGSMTARGKIDYAKRAAKHLATNMGEDDVYSLVIFNDDASVIVPASEVRDPAAVHRAISGIYEGGGTNLYAGLSRGTDEVRRSLEDGQIGRVVLLSDGLATVGITEPNALARIAADAAADRISVSTVGLGLDYNEDVLARIADLGGGSYDFVDNPKELEEVFADELERSASVIARGTRVTIDLPPGVEPLDVYGWDAEQTERGWTVWMGDVTAGTTKKIVTRVRVAGGSEGNVQDVASVSLDYLDLVNDVDSRRVAGVKATATASDAAISASVDKRNAEAAKRAYGNSFLDQSARVWAAGDTEKAKDLANQGEQVLREAATDLDIPELADEADDLGAQKQVYDAYAPSSSAGKRAIKGAKEMYRGRAR